MSTVRSLRRTVLLIVGLTLLGGCGPYITYDVARPLTVRPIPQATEVTDCDTRSATFDAARESIELVRRPRRRLSIKKYNDGYVQPYLEELRNSIELCPDNPYAWSILGIYLGLLHHPEDAVVASERATAILERQLAADGRLSRSLAELYRITLLNTAGFHYIAGRSGDALLNLGRLDEQVAAGVIEMTQPEEIQSLRLKIQALALTGRVEEARENLAILEPMAPEELAPWRVDAWSYDYPQIFKTAKRAAVNHYLYGLVALAEGRPEVAESELERAIELDPKRWEAHFSLAESYAAQPDRTGDARKKLEELVEELDDSEEFVRSEVLLFNLARTCLDAGDRKCALKSLREAINIAAEREADVLHELDESLKRSCRRAKHLACGDSTPEPHAGCDDPVTTFLYQVATPCWSAFSPAEILLGDLLREAEGEAAGDDPEPHYRRALQDPRLVPAAEARAHLALAELAVEDGDIEGFLDRVAQAVRAEPTYRPTLESLERQVFASEDPVLVARTTILLLDALARGDLAAEMLERRNPNGDTLGDQLAARLLEHDDATAARAAYPRLLLARGQRAEADAVYRQALKGNPEAVWAVIGLARMAQGDQRTEEAGVLLNQIQEIEITADPKEVVLFNADRRDIWITSGAVSLKSGDLQDALDAFERALDLDPGNPVALEGKALTEAQLGNERRGS